MNKKLKKVVGQVGPSCGWTEASAYFLGVGQLNLIHV